ncbi:MAG: Crp/Fnr family transcriptional regulator [Gracilibacteraceae bacterium]|jgi:CRP/FNR family cyclic AMP-dependent transcriptional regulator|nr:Crp/Fnr family transcriptional regulator [Gracilibacteraceae bacterium]
MTDYDPIFSYECYALNGVMQKNGVRQLYPAGSVVLRHGDNVSDFYYVAEGRIRYVLLSAEAEEKVMFILGAGSFFGAVPILLSMETAEAEVITEIPTTLYKINQDEFGRLIRISGMFKRELIRGLAKGFYNLKQQIEYLTFVPCKERLVELLRTGADGTTLIDGVWRPLVHQYTQNDIGKIIGANRSTVTKTINELCREGVIRLVNRKIQVRVNKRR